MATGRDAFDVAIAITFGTSWPNRFSVFSDEVAKAVLPREYLTRDRQLDGASWTAHTATGITRIIKLVNLAQFVRRWS